MLFGFSEHCFAWERGKVFYSIDNMIFKYIYYVILNHFIKQNDSDYKSRSIFAMTMILFFLTFPFLIILQSELNFQFNSFKEHKFIIGSLIIFFYFLITYFTFGWKKDIEVYENRYKDLWINKYVGGWTVFFLSFIFFFGSLYLYNLCKG
jgi:hypothetical protein